MPDNGGKKNDKSSEEGVGLTAEGGTSGDGTLDPGETPADELPASDDDPVQQAERELQKAKDKLSDAREKARRDDEIERALAQYEGQQVDLEADEAALIEHRREEREKLNPTPDEDAKVKKAVADLSRPIADLKASIEQQQAALKAKQADLADSKSKLEAVRAAYDRRKNWIKGIQDKHRAADALRKEAADARSRQKRLLALYVLDEALDPTIRREPNPIEFADYKAKINDESADYGTLNRAVADLEASIKEDEQKLAEDAKTLADLQKSFDAEIRAKLTALI